MRSAIIIVATLFLAGCEPAPADRTEAPAIDAPAANYDYRYAFRVPGNSINALEESHARGCEQLGPARCRVVSMKYRVDENNQAAGALALALDPAIARAFGKAATDSAIKARGALLSSEVIDNSATGSVPLRLLRAAEDAETKLQAVTDPGQRAALTTDAARARNALAAINALDRASGPLLATTPVLMTYTSGSGSGVGGASFEGAGESLVLSLAGLATLLAGVGPWLLLLVGGALLLRRILPPEQTRAPVAATSEEPNALRRWFGGTESRQARAHEDA